MTKPADAWYRLPRDAAAFLRRSAAAAGIAVVEDVGADGAPRVLLRADSPAGPPITLSVRLQGPTVRATAHQVISGPMTATALENYNLVARRPWAARAYPAPGAPGIDMSLGLPAPAEPGDAFPFAEQLGILHTAAVQLAQGRLPQYAGPGVPDPAAVMAGVSRWARKAVGLVERVPDGSVVIESRLPGGEACRVEVFVAHGVLAMRVVPTGGSAVAPQAVTGEQLRALAGWNAGAPAGAAAWGPPSLGVHGICVLPAGLTGADDASLAWTHARAREAAAGGLRAAAHAMLP